MTGLEGWPLKGYMLNAFPQRNTKDIFYSPRKKCQTYPLSILELGWNYQFVALSLIYACFIDGWTNFIQFWVKRLCAKHWSIEILMPTLVASGVNQRNWPTLILSAWSKVPRRLSSKEGNQGKVWQGMARYGKVWQGIARYGKVWQGMTRYGKVWQGMARHDKVWQGMAVYGRVWQAMAFSGSL